ncbi:CaiB/BaiF CoA transferase family protein [Sandarakinorhabdus sp. DWP1-3-1]|uniref:CaiB/BaiF CoA transferase family protein n=1 Tax=Sandarakinorhabdus sp. DWP1-3-1 TaxID=2804627 RepID=UPI003CFAE80F
MFPLHGLKVIDLSSVIFGPYCAQWFADLGADVVKLEAPEGDSTRQTGPGLEPGMAALFLGSNRGKRGLVLDLKTADGQAALHRLLETADVLLHSIRPQKLAGLGLDPAATCARHPRLVFAGMHGFGAAGPYGGLPAYDDVIQGMSGIADLMSQSTGSPRYMPTIIADKVSGLTAGLAILAAIVRRQTTGKGGFVEIPMFETLVAFNFVEHFYGHHFDPPLGPLGYPRVMAPWRRPLATADGHVCMMAYTDAHWRGFFTVADAAQHLDDPRFASISTRTTHIDAIYGLAGDLVRHRTTADWLKLLEAAQVPCAPVIPLDALETDPHLAATGFFTRIDTPAGPLRYPGVPVLFDGERPAVSAPPHLGEHTEQILAEAGFTPEDIAALLASRAARQA